MGEVKYSKDNQIAGVGYINEEMTSVLISISGPSHSNPRADFVQVAISIESAITLRAALNAFLKQHGVVEH